MEISERNAIEAKDQALKAELTAQIRRAGEMQTALRLETNRRNTAETHFRRLKQQLLESGQKNGVFEPRHLQGQVDVLLKKLRISNQQLAKAKRDQEHLVRGLQELGIAYSKTKTQIEKLSNFMRTENNKERTRCEEAIVEECVEIAVLRPEQDDPDQPLVSLQNAISESNSDSSSSNSAGGDVHNGAAQNQDARQDSAKNHAEHGFQDLISNHPSVSIDSLKSWTGIQGEGVALTVQSRTGRSLNIEVRAVSDRHVRVSLLSTNESDRRVLWEEKREIIEALRRGGYEVDEISIQRCVK